MALITSFAPWDSRQPAMSLCRYLQNPGWMFYWHCACSARIEKP